MSELIFIFGGISCMAAATVTNPIDMVKVRMQLQGELKSKTSMGFIQTLKTIIRTEGPLSLYRGLAPSLLREGSYSTIRMGLYEPIKDILAEEKNKPLSLTRKIIAGALSGMVGSAIANPTDLIKVRMQAANKSIGHQYKGIWDAFTSILNSEGFAGLYRGVGPTTQRAMILTASQLPSYDHCKHTLLNYGFQEGLQLHIVSSMIAGLVCAITTSPIDLVKSRYMNQVFDSSGKGTIYKSTADCFIKTVKSEGPLGLYKGFFPNWMRIGPHTIVTFIVFEYLRKWNNIKPV